MPEPKSEEVQVPKRPPSTRMPLGARFLFLQNKVYMSLALTALLGLVIGIVAIVLSTHIS